MENRSFFVALGAPRGEDAETICVAYRKVITRYRTELDSTVVEHVSEPILQFSVLRNYSERRHSRLFEKEEPLVPSAEVEVDSFFGGFVPEVLPRRARAAGKDLFVELRLSHDTAKCGGIFPIHVPVLIACPACQGADEESRLGCAPCGGTGRRTTDRMIEVTVPPGVSDGNVARIAMDDVGLPSTDLIVRVNVARPPAP
jgi:hypothetical protein